MSRFAYRHTASIVLFHLCSRLLNQQTAQQACQPRLSDPMTNNSQHQQASAHNNNKSSIQYMCSCITTQTASVYHIQYNCNRCRLHAQPRPHHKAAHEYNVACHFKCRSQCNTKQCIFCSIPYTCCANVTCDSQQAKVACATMLQLCPCAPPNMHTYATTNPLPLPQQMLSAPPLLLLATA